MSVIANVAINVDSRNAVTKLRQVQAQSQQTERAVNGLGAAVGKLVAAFAAVQAVKFVFVQAAELETQRRSLEVLTGSAQKAGQIIKQLQDLGAVTPFTSTELIDAAKRLQAFGVEADKVVETTRRLADVSGATGAELQGLVTAYGQVQAKGRLQGEELLQFQERGVALQKVLREQYKLSGDEFQEALSKGRISAEAVTFAIQKLTDAGGKYANGAIAQSDTLNGKLSTLQDSFQRLAQNIGKFFEPVFKFLIDGINAFIERVNNAGRLQAEERARQASNVAASRRFGLRAVNPFDQEVQAFREQVRRSALATFTRGGAIAPSAPTAGAPPPLLAPRGGRDSSKKEKDEAERKAKELNRLLQESLELNTKIGNVGKDQLSQLRGQIDLVNQILPLQLKEVELSTDAANAAKAKQVVNKAADLERKRLLEEIANVENQIKEVTAEALDLRVSVLGGLLPEKSPLEQALEEINKELIDADKKAEELLRKLSELAGTNPEAARARGALGNLRADLASVDPAEIASRRLVQPDIEALQQQNQELRNAGRELTTLDQLVIKYGDDWEKINPTIKQQLVDLANTNQQLKEATEKQQQLKDLYNGIAATIEDGIVNAIQTGIDGLIDGTKDLDDALKEILRGVLAEIGNQLIKFAVRLAFQSFGFADGAAFASNGIQRFASGGVVTKPTLFPFADGGMTRTGLMGEAGPEAILPLKRGANGRLGVEADLSSAMNRYRGGGSGGGGSFSSGGNASLTAAGGPITVDVRYSMERINSVDYVTNEQFQEGIRQAAAQGAAQGEQRTLRRLQNSPSTRRRLGV